MQPKKNQKNRLQVIYFFHAGKTKTLSVPKWLLTVVCLTALAIVAWSVTSAMILTQTFAESEDLKERLKTARRVLFQQQVKHEKVFDRAYPPVAVNLSPTPEEVVDTQSTQETPTPLETDVVEKVNSDATAEEIVSESQLVNKIDKVNVRWKRGRLGVEFALKNEDEQRMSGYVYAIVHARNQAGQKMLIPSPSRLHLTKNGTPLDLKKANRYSIRNFKQNSLEFTFPADFSGKVEEVVVHMVADNGRAEALPLELTEAVAVTLGKGKTNVSVAINKKEKQISRE